MERRLWSREELLVALNLYLKLPFGKMHSRNPEVIRLADCWSGVRMPLPCD